MKNQGRPRIGKRKQFLSKLVVQPDDLPDGVGWQSLQKSANGSLLGQAFQSQKGKKKTIVMELVGFVDALPPGNEQVEQHHDQINWIKIRPLGSRLQNALQSAPETQLVTKPLNEEETAVVCQSVGFKRKLQ